MISLLRLGLKKCAGLGNRHTRCLQSLFLSNIHRRGRYLPRMRPLCWRSHELCTKTILGQNSPERWDAPKINIAAANHFVAPRCAKKLKKFVPKRFGNQLKRKPLVIRAILAEAPPYPWLPAYQRLGYLIKTIMRIPQSDTGNPLPNAFPGCCARSESPSLRSFRIRFVERLVRRSARPSRHHQKNIDDEKRNRNIVEQRSLRRIGP